VPLYSYYGAAIATLLAYAVMAVLSYLLGQQKHPVPYEVKKISLILLVSIALYLPNYFLNLSGWSKYLVASLSVISFVAYIFLSEKELLKKLKNVSGRNN
jgi:O-antigen/teichoic acid export membrane protein